jgi:hypothetical protein
VDYYEFKKDDITAQAVKGGSVVVSFGHSAYSMTPETARSVILKLVAALLVADAKNIRGDILAAADKIHAEEF